MINHTCPPNIENYVRNLTTSYTDKVNEPNMVSASVIMFTLAGLFFNLNLFSGISDVSAILDPKVRLFLSSALSLFLPVMSYLFSEAKNNHAATATGGGNTMSASSTTGAADLSLRAGIILAWMLLVELLRKKVDEIRMRGYSGTVQRAGRVVWLGSLVFFTIKSTGRKAVFAILWILCATRVVQRIAFTEVGKRSYAHGKNARLMSSYIDQILGQKKPRAPAHVDAHATGDKLLKECKYIVMGEEKLLNIEPTADGYKLDKKKSASSLSVKSGGSMMMTSSSWRRRPTRSASRGTRTCWCKEASSSPCSGRSPPTSACPGHQSKNRHRPIMNRRQQLMILISKDDEEERTQDVLCLHMPFLSVLFCL